MDKALHGEVREARLMVPGISHAKGPPETIGRNPVCGTSAGLTAGLQFQHTSASECVLRVFI